MSPPGKLNRRQFVARSAASFLALASGPTACRGEEPRQPRGDARLPNVLLITLDTTRADHLGAYGHRPSTSPNLDSLARGSLVFTQAFSTSSWTLPAHASLFTGKFPSSHGAQYDADGPLLLSDVLDVPRDEFRARGLGPSEVTLADSLGRAGFATAGFVSGPWMKSIFGLGRGFQLYDDSGIETRNGRAASAVTDGALRWIRSVRQPFFAFLNYFDPHKPYSPPAGLAERFASPGRPEVEVLYDAEIFAMDRELGRLFAGLEASGQLENTIVVVTADHGEMFGERGLTGHGKTLSREEIHIPLIVRLPDPQPPTAPLDHPVQLVDVLPEILRRLDLPVPPCQGTGLFEATHPVIAEVSPLVLEESWKAIITRDYKLACASSGRCLLYDRREDPLETVDLSRERETVVADLRGTLDGYLATLPSPSGEAGTPQAIDPETRKALKSLGYLD